MAGYLWDYRDKKKRSQTVRSSDQAGERGYDAAKKTEGIKRHVLVDTLGLLLAVCVTKADVIDFVRWFSDFWFTTSDSRV